MRIAAFLVALMCSVSAGGRAQEHTPIEWSKERKLSKEDFKGNVPSISSASSFSWLAIDVSWGCQDGKPVTHARAMFDPSRSWWRAEVSNLWQNIDIEKATRSELESRRSSRQLDAQLLRHEQAHFDITELAVRKIRKEFESLKETCATSGATTNLDKVIAEIDSELRREQARYDKETAHGINAPKQREWESTIRRELQRQP